MRANHDVNPFYLQYALRLPSTLEQFRKWSTGSSYPAILDEDVAKTLIPVPSAAEQDRIAAIIVSALRERQSALNAANDAWRRTVNGITAGLVGAPVEQNVEPEQVELAPATTIQQVQHILSALPPLDTDNSEAPEQAEIAVAA